MASTINASTTAGIVTSADTSGVLQLQTANTTAVTVDASQNVGIGTSSPNNKLSVASTSQDIALFSFSGGTGLIKLKDNATTNNPALGVIGNDFAIFTGAGPTERMRIDSNGNLLVGTTAGTLGGSNSLEVKAANEVTSFDRNTAADGVITRWKKQGTTIGYISTNTYSLPSDSRVKSNIETIGYGLEFVNALRPVQYNTTFQDQDKLSKKNFGLIAQEVEQTLEQFGKSVDDVTFLEKFEPENETESRYGLGYQNLVPVLIKAIQELKAELDATKAEVAALKGVA